MWIPAYEKHIQFNTCPRCKSHMDDFCLNELASKLMLNPEFLRYRITQSATAKPNAGE
jgi:hypothetical protein